MRSNYKPIGPYIRLVDERNLSDKKDNLLGVSVSKKFIKSIANTVGTDFTLYRVVKRNQFTYIPDTSRRGDKIGVALLDDLDEGLVSQAYTVFEISDLNKLDAEYLMMWFRRPEFDRYARFISHGSVREIFEWEDMCNVSLPIPSITKQKEIVKEYNVIQNRILLNKQLIQKLEETVQAIYKQWFVDFEFPNENGKPYKTNGGVMVESELGEIPEGWEFLKLGNLVQTQYGFTASADSKNIGPKFLRITDIAQSQISWESVPHCAVPQTQIEKYLLKCGDIVIARTGATAGYAKRINKHHPKAVFASYLVRMISLDYSMNIYLGIIIDSAKYREFILSNAEGSAQPQANATLMSEFKIYKPSSEIILKFNKIVEPILDLIEISQIQNTKLTQFANLLLSKLATVEN